MKKGHKLVRDNIPEIMRQDGETPVTHTADDTEYGEALLQKLFEETKELLAANGPREIAEEIVDLLEVVRAIAEHHRLTPEEIELIRQQKATQCGAFNARVILHQR